MYRSSWGLDGSLLSSSEHEVYPRKFGIPEPWKRPQIAFL
ncbi:hypothetical protein FOPG_19851 [Fusarium oxysporum f. sp. conglutinans race 2 54008]|uniref:Uncharacterized protein n=1 Tax=Fusarium oxysporum f. sp. conglutinans race 2 54008 TaxID=1089457 RepID=X0GKP9_FUSOX|nr:hypothetical protein FOPG_19851 [Fusarium oxysporum f. sp. conglutinans race 2 54008]